MACILVLSLVLSVFWLLNEQGANSKPVVSMDAKLSDTSIGSPSLPDPVIEEFKLPLPSNAILGERVIHFSDRGDYLWYLDKLSELGLSPLGKIDGLLSIRVHEDVLSQLNPAMYGGEETFSYRVEQPLPPTEPNPELLAQLRAFEATARTIAGNLVEGDGSGVVVAILDSGIQLHSYFDEVHIDSIDLTGNGISGPGSDHGTAVASILAGKAGIVPTADLLVIRVLDDQGVGTSFDVADGIVRAVDRGAQLINLSLGADQDVEVLQKAVRYAHAQGVVLIAAAGNDGYDRLPYPAAYPQVLSVTAVDRLRRQAVFPNQSSAIDFAAPGVGILTADEANEVRLFSGTSAATPFVTGTLAALLSADSAMSSQETVTVLRRYLDDAGAVGLDPYYGGGLLNWDRLRERNTTDVNDIALADIHLPSDARPGTTMPIEVIVQNRGTRWLTAAELTVMAGGSEPVEFTIGTLAPGQTTTRKIYKQLPTKQSDKALEIAAQVLAKGLDDDDVRPENNVKAVLFRPTQ